MAYLQPLFSGRLGIPVTVSLGILGGHTFHLQNLHYNPIVV